MIIAVISVEQRIDSRNFHVRHSKVSDEHEMLKAKGDDKILKTLSMKLQHSNCTVTPSKTFQLRYKNIKKMKLFFCFFQFISNSEFRLFISGKVLKMHQYFTNTNTSTSHKIPSYEIYCRSLHPNYTCNVLRVVTT
jgi:hypothetical protein